MSLESPSVTVLVRSMITWVPFLRPTYLGHKSVLCHTKLAPGPPMQTLDSTVIKGTCDRRCALRLEMKMTFGSFGVP